MSSGGIPLWRLILECALVGLAAALAAVWVGSQIGVEMSGAVIGGAAGGAAGGASAAFGAGRVRAARKRSEGGGDG